MSARRGNKARFFRERRHNVLRRRRLREALKALEVATGQDLSGAGRKSPP
jgi:hypothetical protein